MNRDTANSYAAPIVKARLEGKKLTDYPGQVPDSIDEAYVIQDALIRAMDSPVVGWKVGATAAAARKRLGLDEPFSGPIFEQCALPSPARVSLAESDLRIVEAEIGFCMKKTLVPRSHPYTTENIITSIGTVHPVFELANKRLPGTFKDDVRWFVADGGLNQALIYGTGIKFLPGMELIAETVNVSIDDKHFSQGIGANAMGNPLDVVVWLANHLSARGIALKTGNWIATGLICDMVFAELGAKITAEYLTLGSVVLET